MRIEKRLQELGLCCPNDAVTGGPDHTLRMGEGAR